MSGKPTTTREQHSRYNRSPKGHARMARYRITVKGLLAEMRAHAKERGTR